MSDETIYRLSWEMVSTAELWRYCNANPSFYKNVTQLVPNSQIPDEHWHRVERVDTSPWQQYSQLRAWADADREFVRNVVLEKAVRVDAEWEPVVTQGFAERLDAIKGRKPLHDAIERGPAAPDREEPS